MKTTIEVSDAIFHSAKEFARKNQTTQRALVEEGLRRVLNEPQAKAKAKPSFKLNDARVHGNAMLIFDPRGWQKLEEDETIRRVLKSNP